MPLVEFGAQAIYRPHAADEQQVRASLCASLIKQGVPPMGITFEIDADDRIMRGTVAMTATGYAPRSRFWVFRHAVARRWREWRHPLTWDYSDSEDELGRARGD